MSTGADCFFYEKPKGKWFYQIQNYPYGETEDYTKHGPFSTFRSAQRHLDNHYANPGGYSIEPADDSCKHENRTDGECDYCGDLGND